jgi:prepilin-type N-terminal cleavage/methylation domain-containing protein
MNKNEQGFSLIELAVAMAIMVSLGAIGFNMMNSAADSIISNQLEAQQEQQDNFNSMFNIN